MVVCQVASSLFSVPRKIARLRAPAYLNASYSDLYRQGHPQQAREALQKARAAAPRPGRELADQGRRREIDALLQESANP